jgi:hypothetical protein
MKGVSKHKNHGIYLENDELEIEKGIYPGHRRHRSHWNLFFCATTLQSRDSRIVE